MTMAVMGGQPQAEEPAGRGGRRGGQTFGVDMGAGKEAVAEGGCNSGRAFTFVRVEESWS